MSGDPARPGAPEYAAPYGTWEAPGKTAAAGASLGGRLGEVHEAVVGRAPREAVRGTVLAALALG
ncbi:hypothetical protein ABZ840_34325, partial [Streptomyces sp. NPDC047117]|uniref:hypothetical protein n=1 Tax=Streptomyces sp. NPDC047117 TaxID=3155379 RepID=UPI0033E6DF42